MPIQFIPNPAVGQEVAVTPEMAAALLGIAEVAVEVAKSVAPVATGAYRDSIHAEGEIGKATIIADDEKAKWIEFGTGEPGPTPAFAPLRRGADVIGLGR